MKDTPTYHNFYKDIPTDCTTEVFESILKSKHIHIERITSTGQITAKEAPYIQAHDEWVIVLQGKAKLWLESTGELTLNKGDYILIPKNTKHLVTYTSASPKTLWLAIHITA